MDTISDFYVNLTDSGLNFSTTDTNYQGGGDGVYIQLSSAGQNSGYSSYTYFSAGGNGSLQWADFGLDEANQPSLPLNIIFTVNDDDDSNIWLPHCINGLRAVIGS